MIRSALALVLLAAQSLVATAAPVTLTAADGVRVHGEYWPAAQKAAPLVLAFHQAGASHAEYVPIAARLNREGFSVLAIDQRSGDGMFGAQNRTAMALGHETSFDSALPDLEAALAWGRAHADGAPLLAWGSSYSAALVFLLAAKHPGELQGVLAFSPGEYLARKDAVKTAARALRVPVFVDQASDPEELAASKAILAVVPGPDKQLFVPRVAGVHGSSTLREDRNAKGAAENWDAVLAFLARFRPRS